MSSSESEGDVYPSDCYDYEEYDDEYNDEGEMTSYSGIAGSEDDDDGERERQNELERFAHCILNFRQGSYDDAIQSAISNYVPDELEPLDEDARERIQIRELDNLKGQLRAPVTQYGGISICSGDNRLGHGPKPFTSHDVSLNSYWDSFTRDFAALESSEKISPHFIIGNVQLTEEVLGMLAASLTGKNLRKLELGNNGIRQDGITSVARIVESIPSLSSLCLSRNQIDDLTAVKCLSTTLKSHPNLQRIELSDCSIGNNVDVILAILQSDVSSINLNYNGIGSPGAEVISGYLETNPPIHSLEIDYNEFNENDAVRFSQALRRNTNLNEFCARQSARGNNFSIAGIKSLLNSVFDPTSLDSIAESNHRCTLSLFPMSSDIRDHVEMINTPGLSYLEIRKRKLLIALSERDSLLGYIEDVSVELMPAVLGLILEAENGNNQINMVYAILRWWSMPSLFSFHQSATAKRKRYAFK
mmetsp:Transcript_20541/g.44584  ORF Transcript_20541/g.44584 Transcript_20541/m.44584 type:complete len:474 (+) Transcript_20541:78-1499(+)